MAIGIKMRKWFGKSPCRKCGRMISLCGFGQYQHEQWHKRQEKKKEELPPKVQCNVCGEWFWNIDGCPNGCRGGIVEHIK